MLKHDVVIVGGGLSGLRAAIELKGKCDAAIICKSYPNLAHSTQAQGGINAAINPKDNWEDHVYDTIYGGDYLNDQDAVEVLCKDAPRVIDELVGYGVNFNRTKDGEIAQRAFGAQRFNRTTYAADRTGHALLHALYKRALELGLKIYNEMYVVSLDRNDKSISGLVVMDLPSGELIHIAAKAVIMTTGGAGRIYGKTTNPDNTGDGIAIAYNAGAAIMDMEMVQFHPTTLRGPNKLLSEAARGEGAYLINANGERFMKKYAPEKMELASRDVVSRAEAIEIKEGRGTYGDSVLLDFRHLKEDEIMTKVPDIWKNALELVGIDIRKDPVPVQPGQHYTMGGIAVSIDCSSTLNGLFAAGECSCLSVHGANRLGGNSLMETLVFGRIAGQSALNYINNKSFGKIDEKILKAETERISKWMNNNNAPSPREVRLKMGKIMDEKVGPFRDENMLCEALEAINKLIEEGMHVSENSKVFNSELQIAYENYFMLRLAQCTIISAIERKESRGAHTRTDYPKRDDKNFLTHMLCTISNNGPKVSHRPVKITKYEPKERKY